MEKKSGFGRFVGGLIIGTTFGILFAPKKGSETRKELRDKTEDFLEKAKEVDINDVEEYVDIKIEEISDDLKNLDSEKVIALAKEQAEHIKNKCDDLVEYAIASGKPVVEKTAEAARVKTIQVLKETINKLEKSENTKKKNK
jgi:gas vesicle protein